MMATETFAVTNKKFIAQVTDLFNENGVICSEDELHSVLKSKKSVLVATSIDDRLIAAGCALQLNSKNATEVLGWKYPDESRMMKGYYGLLTGAAVHPEFMGYGIGNAITQERLRFLTKINCWEVLGITELKPIQEFGFKEVEVHAKDGQTMVAMALG